MGDKEDQLIDALDYGGSIRILTIRRPLPQPLLVDSCS